MPGSAASAGRPVGVSWSWALPLVGLLVALLVTLPNASSAGAAPAHAPEHAAPVAEHPKPATGHSSPVAHSSVHAPSPLVPPTLCAADGSQPAPGHGCSSHPCPGQDAQLPNAPPQPGAANLPLLVPPSAPAAPKPASAVDRPGRTPDLHLLQVNRT
ncbi:hypothetical protein [Kitasatospora azatica]|uniref:hypothetical protein n=1 Tax=Kitasatospora azatica TaxID=58347 RepID=UPI0005609ACD|nr:hypothetical protein [Kitasatospora azatica]